MGPCRLCTEITELNHEWLCKGCQDLREVIDAGREIQEHLDHARKDFESDMGADSLGQRS